MNAPGTSRRSMNAPFEVHEIDAIQRRATFSPAKTSLPIEQEEGGEAVGVRSAPRPDAPAPLTNRGGSHLPEPVATELLESYSGGRLVMTDSGPRLIPLQKPTETEACVIDYASMTFAEAAVYQFPGVKPFSDMEFAVSVATYARDALIRLKCDIQPMRAGIFGYHAAVKIGDFGIAAAGGNNATCLLSLTGHAFASADVELPQRLYSFVMAIRSAKLTRIDIAYDDFDGSLFRVRNIPEEWRIGMYSPARSPRPPKFQQLGEWASDDPDGKGLTAQIGSRAAGKVIRIYEKGRQLGIPSSEWVRAEAELRNSVFNLVPEMLVRPSAFFVMLCPSFARIAYQGEASKLQRTAREALDSLDAVLNVISHQYGGYLHVLREEGFFSSDSELLDRLSRVPKERPQVLRKIVSFHDAALYAQACESQSVAYLPEEQS